MTAWLWENLPVTHKYNYLVFFKKSMQIITKNFSQTLVMFTGQTANAMTSAYFPDTMLLLIVYCLEGFSNWNKTNIMVSNHLSSSNA